MLSSCYSGSSSMTGSIYIVKLKVLPCPRPFDSTVIVPLPDSTICQTMVSPSPTPALLSAAVRYNFPKRVKSLGKSSAAMPVPESLICTLISLSTIEQLALISIQPSRVNLIAFLTKLMTTCLKRFASPISFGRTTFSVVQIKPTFFALSIGSNVLQMRSNVSFGSKGSPTRLNTPSLIYRKSSRSSTKVIRKCNWLSMSLQYLRD